MPPVLPDPPPLFLGGTSILEGRVTDAESGKPVGGARVYLTVAGTTDGKCGVGGFQPFREVYRSDDDGRFRVAGLIDQRYQLDVEAPGFLGFVAVAEEAYSAQIPHRHSQEWPMATRLDSFWFSGWTKEHPLWFLLSAVYPDLKAGQVTVVDVRLRRGKILRGQVRDDSGTPVAQAAVEVESQSVKGYQHSANWWGTRSVRPNRPTTTDSDGSFEVTVHPALNARLRVTAPGRVAAVRDVDPLTSEGLLEVSLTAARILTGRVLTEGGHEPDRDVQVSVVALKPGGAIVNSSTDTRGNFSIDGIPPPPLLLVASDQFLGAAAMEFSETGRPLDLRLQREKLLKGVVVQADGKPAPGAFVYQGVMVRTSLGELGLGQSLCSASDGVQRSPDGRWAAAANIHYSIATYADPEGGFELKAILPQEGRVFLCASAAGVMRDETTLSGWFEVREDLVLRLGSARAVSDERDPVSVPAAAPEQTAPVDRWIEGLRSADRKGRRELITELRAEACRKSGGHPPAAESDRPDLIPVFVAGLRNDDAEVCTQAVCALAYMNHSGTFDPLIDALRHSNSTVRYYAVMGLEWMGRRAELKERAVSALREVLGRPDDSFDVPLHAASSLVELRALEDPAWFLRSLREGIGNRALAAGALETLGRRDAVEILIEALKGGEYQHHLAETLHKLTGFHGFQDYAAWRHWLDKNRGTLPPQLPMEEEPADAEGYYRRGRRRWDRKEFDPAIEDFTKAVELDPKHADSWASRGTLRAWKKEDHSGGLADIEKALTLEPDNVNLLRGAGWVRFLAGDAPGALKALSRAIELKPGDPHLWWARAGYRRQTDDREGAIEDTRRALELGGKNWDRRSSAELFLKELGAEAYDPRVPKICDVCKKRPSIVHDTRIEHGKPVEMHYCAECRSVMPK